MKCATHGNESCPNLRCQEEVGYDFPVCRTLSGNGPCTAADCPAHPDPLRGAFWPIKKVSREHLAELYPSDATVDCNYNFPLMTRLEYGQPGRVPTDHAWALMLSEDPQPEAKRVEDEYPGDE